jgi:uncharacterized membrane protein YagU involved in acid resistance
MTSALPSGPFPAVFWAGLVSGILDITAAFVTAATRGISPARLLQGIASGLLGAKSFQGGWRIAALGAICHFFIAFSAAEVFYVLSRLLPWLTRQALLYGALYGIAVYLVMYWIVKPLSLVRPTPFSWSATAIAIVTHIVCVGTPIALVVHRYSR